MVRFDVDFDELRASLIKYALMISTMGAMDFYIVIFKVWDDEPFF